MPDIRDFRLKSDLDRDYVDAMQYGDAMVKALEHGDQVIDSMVGNNSEKDAVTGGGANAIIEQWEMFKTGFKPFGDEFQTWKMQHTVSNRASDEVQNATGNMGN